MDTTETVILSIETAVLLTTLIFMYIQYRGTTKVMRAELDELRKNVRIATHEDIYEKLLTLYYKYMEYPEDLKDIFRGHQQISPKEIRQRYMVFAILDILYLMYLQRDTLDRGLLRTWRIWIGRIFEEPKIKEIYDMVKDEYDPRYVSHLEGEYREFQANPNGL